MGHEDKEDIDLKLSAQPYTQSEESIAVMEMQSTVKLTDIETSDDEFLLKPCGGPPGIWLVELRTYLLRTLKFDEQIVNWIKYILFGTIALTYIIYVLVRWIYSDCKDIGWRDGYGFLLIILIPVLVYMLYSKLIYPLINKAFKKSPDHLKTTLKTIANWGFYCLLGCGVLLFLILSLKDAYKEPRRYLSLGGYFLLIFIAFLFSKHPDYVRWDMIARGISLHMLLGFILIKWSPGRDVLSIFSEKIIEFLEFSYVGARFIYGDMLIDLGIFLFKSLSVLFFLAMVINILFYYGVLQRMFKRLGQLMQILIGTTIIESSNSVASTFLGMSESPLLFKPYLVELTSSEIHAVMTSGFSTVAGTVLAAYVSFGADPVMLVSASAMAAPASLTLAKLFYPETRPTKTSIKNFTLYKSNDSNAVDAACKGAMIGCQLVPAIAANVLAFISLIAFFNAVLAWIGKLAGIPHLSFEGIIGWLFIPLSWCLGVDSTQIVDVARLIGIKTVVNEFVGYKQLGVLKKANELSVRSEAIATYAMCGFANPASVAIFVSSLVTVCPEKTHVFTQVAVRAFISGSFSSFLSASLAGFLTPENGFDSAGDYNYQAEPLSQNNSCYYYSW